MIGMNAQTGKALSGDAHLAQSIRDILTTPIGTRLMRRDYGSLLFELIDQPVNGALLMLLRAATALALRQWEPRLNLDRIQIDGEPAAGNLAIHLEGRRTDTPDPNARIALTIPLPGLAS